VTPERELVTGLLTPVLPAWLVLRTTMGPSWGSSVVFLDDEDGYRGHVALYGDELSVLLNDDDDTVFPLGDPDLPRRLREFFTTQRRERPE